MNKNIALMISVWLITPEAISSEMPDFCQSGAFTCHKLAPNYVVAYPTGNPPHHEKTNISHDTHYKTPQHFHSPDIIEVDLGNLTWSAYDHKGESIRSGHVSGGKDYCADINRACKTVTGTFTIYKKGTEDCKSTRFPVGRGGAPMPFCMFFHGGYALHGSYSVPNYNASHGCIRMSPEDAQWLNEVFVQEGLTQVHIHY